jgi:hypothetical protein
LLKTVNTKHYFLIYDFAICILIYKEKGQAYPITRRGRAYRCYLPVLAGLANITSIGPGPILILTEDGSFVNKIRVMVKQKADIVRCGCPLGLLFSCPEPPD